MRRDRLRQPDPDRGIGFAELDDYGMGAVPVGRQPRRESRHVDIPCEVKKTAGKRASHRSLLPAESNSPCAGVESKAQDTTASRNRPSSGANRQTAASRKGVVHLFARRARGDLQGSSDRITNRSISHWPAGPGRVSVLYTACKTYSPPRQSRSFNRMSRGYPTSMSKCSTSSRAPSFS